MEAYPLTWPEGWARSNSAQPALFKVTMSEAIDHLYNELDRLGATDIIVSSNMRVRLDGRPYADQNRMADEGVAVYFNYNGSQQCIPCDKWTTVKDNIRAVGLTVEALRGLERWGAKEMVNAAFKGFKALPAAGDTTSSAQKLWFDVLQVSPQADWDVIEAAYRRLLHKVHPDKGGSEAAFAEVQAAFKQAKEMVR